ncbi:MarR family winged helix-turn-helix transcriptional regulator [Gulosibacter sp. 10]|uniref:MarR family winged helix-turn-helix transcriptional regulator n=1 Tax=Gulosibacter sp. 10 TaxID=1255570 RepID=UPI00097F0495|nr:MarR family transcriptional regulator [Gulosibacter sp. 10]SJM70020.1 Transcriptional regulator, MarR family [Gulosibacter sp. 10]
MEQPGQDYRATIGYRLKEAQSALRSRMDEALAPLGLSTPQYSCLEVIGRNPGASNSEIARQVFVTRQATSRLLRALQDRGLVTRPEQAESGRVLPTQLTDEGRGLLARAAAVVYPIERRMGESLSEAQRAALGEALLRCAEALAQPPEAR